MPFTPNKFSTLESFVSEVTFVPLETKDDCLIGGTIAQAKVHKNLIYINSDGKQLLVFDLNGKFLREIGKRGQGPGEFINVRDFIFTNEGTIEILDFRKIERYSLEGKHLGTVNKFDFLGKDFYCNPHSFCRAFTSGYFLWGGIIEIQDVQLLERSRMMYHVNDQMQVVNAYFDTKLGDKMTKDRFKYYKDKILIIPSMYNYNIYQVNPNDSISIRYTFDFGNYGLETKEDLDISSGLDTYVHNIDDYVETDLYLYFSFIYKNRFHYMLYAKKSKQFYIYSSSGNDKDFKLFPAKAVHNDRLISLLEMYGLKIVMGRMSEENIKKWGLERFKNSPEDDNPVLVLYKTKF